MKFWGGITELKNSIANLKSGTVPIVRHIQRGTVNMQNTSTVTLSGFSNLSKMMVLLEGTASFYQKTQSSTYAYAYGKAPYVSSLSTTSLGIGNGDSDSGRTISYQVIEFY